METALLVVAFFISVVIHEVSHGLAAYALGDATAKDAGRLTLNPLPHISLFWTVLLPAALFFATHGHFAIGMAKPVPVDFSRLRKPRSGMSAVALAGPFSNLVLAAILALVWSKWKIDFWLYAVYLNLGLAVFNLIPIPPLDGSRIVAGILPPPLDKNYLKLERYGFFIVLALYATGLLYAWVIPGVNFLAKLLNIPSLNFNG